jgi:hypothetical protein
MKSLNEVDINVKDAFKVSVSIDGVGYSAANIKDLLRITPMSEDISIEQLIDETKHTFAGDDGIPFQFHGLHMSVNGTHMLFLTLTGKVILIREVEPYPDAVATEADKLRYCYQIYDRVNYVNTFVWWLRDATATPSDYINLCKQLGISYAENLN